MGALSFLGVLGYIITSNSGLLLLFRLINGAGYVLCTVCMTTWLSYLVPFSHVGEAMSFYGIMNALAMAFAPAVSIGNFVAKILENPAPYARKDFGVDKPGTDGDKPAWY